jgi:hypothetical protein
MSLGIIPVAQPRYGGSFSMMIPNLETQLLALIRRTSPSTLLDRSRLRLAYFIASILLAQTLVLRKIASTRHAVQGDSPHAASHDRRLRRILADHCLTWERAYAPVVQDVLKLNKAKRLHIIIDETSQCEHFRVLTAALWYRNRAVPLAWVQWLGQRPKQRSYWEYSADLLQMLASIVPPEVKVLILADRAFGHPRFTDQVAAHGWDWLVRVQQQTWLNDVQGRCCSLRERLPEQGGRWKARGQVFKGADWRDASVVAYWSRRHKEPLLLASSLAPSWELIAEYKRRGAIEAMFRDWKSSGFGWEESQVRKLERHERLLLGLAWATLVVLVLGEEVAEEVLGEKGQGWRSRSWEGKHSLFRLGLDRLAGRLAGQVKKPIVWELRKVDGEGWQSECRRHHAREGSWQQPGPFTMRAAA